MSRKLSLLVVVLVLGLLFSVSATAETIHVLMGAHPWSKILTENLKEFEQATGITVKYEILSEDILYEKTILELTSGTGSYDVIADVIEWVPGYAAPGFVVPFEDLMAKYGQKHGVIDLDGMIQAVRKAHMWAGKQYSVPLNAGSRMFYYRNDLLKAAGLEPPKTWEELLEAARALTKDTDGDGKIDTYGMSMSARKGPWIILNWAPWLFAAGGVDMDENYRVTLGEEAIAAAKLWTQLIQEGLTPPGLTNYAIDENRAGVIEGRLAMVSFETVAALALGDPQVNPHASHMGYSLVPVRDKNTQRTASAVLGGWGLVVPKGSRKQEAAYRFVQWATNRTNDRRIALAVGQGAFPESYTEKELVEKFPALPYILETLENAKRLFPVPENVQLVDILGTELSNAFAGLKTPEKAMKDAEVKMNQVLKDAGWQK